MWYFLLLFLLIMFSSFESSSLQAIKLHSEAYFIALGSPELPLFWKAVKGGEVSFMVDISPSLCKYIHLWLKFLRRTDSHLHHLLVLQPSLRCQMVFTCELQGLCEHPSAAMFIKGFQMCPPGFSSKWRKCVGWGIEGVLPPGWVGTYLSQSKD